MECERILDKLLSLSNKENLYGMSRYGINTSNALGIPIPKIRLLAKEIGKNHILALDLWNTNFHEAKILASMIGIPEILTSDQMESWARDFDSWDICDQTCNNLFWKSPLAYYKSFEWCRRNEEFVKRAGYVLMAVLAVHDKKRNNEDFFRFFHLIYEGSTDERIYVKKAVNWALRQIGKRNNVLNKKAIEVAIDIKKINSKTAEWISNDALRELQDIKILQKIKNE